MSPLDPILHYDASGKLIKSFGAGLLVGPHGIFVDRDGNVWVTDYQDNAPRAARGAGGAAGAQARAAAARRLPVRCRAPRSATSSINSVPTEKS